MKKYKILAGLAAAMPLAALAQDVGSVIGKVSEIINLIIPIIIALALVIFLWGIIKYITAGGDEGKRSEARNYIIYGIIGLFVMVAVWGLVKLVGNTLDIDTGGSAPGIPGTPTR